MITPDGFIAGPGGKIGEADRKMKQEPGRDMIIYGSSTIVSQLTDLGLSTGCLSTR